MSRSSLPLVRPSKPKQIPDWRQLQDPGAGELDPLGESPGFSARCPWAANRLTSLSLFALDLENKDDDMYLTGCSEVMMICDRYLGEGLAYRSEA